MIGAVAELPHYRARLVAVFRDIRVVARKAAQQLRRDAPGAVRRRQHRAPEIALALAENIDEGLAVEAEPDRAAQFQVVERLPVAIDDQEARYVPRKDAAIDLRRLALD